jgi:photosystem II stability/assembly factor-like uncharacterized protein
MLKRFLLFLPLFVAGLLGGAGQQIPGLFPGLRWLGVVLGLMVFPFLAASLGYRASAPTGKAGSGGQIGFQIGLIGLGVFLVIGAFNLLARWDALKAATSFFPDWLALALVFLPIVVFPAGLLCLVALSGGVLGGAIAVLRTGPPAAPTVPQGYAWPPQHALEASRLPPASPPPGRSASLPPQRPSSFPPPFPPARPTRRRFAAGTVLCLLIIFLLLEAGNLAVYAAVSGWWQSLPLSQVYRTSAPLAAVTWAGRQFVAVGDSGTILTSPDGHTWTGQTSGTSLALSDVAWSGTQFVVVGHYVPALFGPDLNENIILTSPDGHTWTARNPGTPFPLFGVTWAGGQFVVVGDSGTILTSPDGHTWTGQTSGTSLALSDVAWLGKQFVVVGRFVPPSVDVPDLNENIILTSPDGRTWTGQTSPAFLSAVTWAGRQFVAVGDSGTILTSPDGHTWTGQTSGTSLALSDVAWSGTQFVVVGDRGTILTSPDGRAWTARSPGTSLGLSSITWLGRQFVAVGDSGTILTSPDGRTWTAQHSGTSADLFAVVWSGRQFVVLGNESTPNNGDTNTILTSPDGRTWTTVNPGTS